DKSANTVAPNNKTIQKNGSVNGMETEVPESALKDGVATTASTKANKSEMKEIKPDSVKNCRIKADLSEPSVLRIPTSLDLLRDCAVDKFMKLTLANTIRNKPMNDRM